MKKKNKAKAQSAPAPVEARARTSFTVPKQLIAALYIAISVLSVLAVHFSHLPEWQQKRSWFYYDQNKPLLTTMDGYYYARLATDLQTNEYARTDDRRVQSERPFPVPLIVSAIALLHRITGFSLESIAFFLPPLLALSMVLVLFLWSRAVGNLQVGLIASLAAASCVYWYTRTCLGRFDTDALNPFFIFFMSFFAYRFATVQTRRRYIYLAVVLVSAVLNYLWWVQAGYLSILLIAAAYGLSFFIKSSREEKLAKGVVLGLGGVMLVLLLFNVDHLFPQPVARFFDLAVGQFKLIAKQSTSAFPEVGQSISELAAPSLRSIVTLVSGNVLSFLFSLAGIGFLAWRRKDIAIFLAPGILLSLAVIFSRRFLIFFVPIYALGVGYFAVEVILKSKPLERIRNVALREALVVLLAVGLLAPGYVSCLKTFIAPEENSGSVAMARSISREPPSASSVWTWWDDGYFVQYFSGRRTFSDGGMQTPERTYLSAFPLSCDDPVLARNWIRFFSVRDVEGLKYTAEKLGGVEAAVRFLKDVFAAPENSESILLAHGLNNVETWRSFLFPKEPVYLYLRMDFVNKAYWWYYFGTWDVATGVGTHPQFSMIQQEGCFLDANQGILATAEGRVLLGKIIDLTATGLNVKDLHREDLPVAVAVQGNPMIYTLDPKLYQSVGIRLLFQGPSKTPGFKSVFYHPMVGGVWKVE